MPNLILMFKDKILRALPLTLGNKVTIGRNSTNTIVIDNLAVSGYHAAIFYDASGLQITDLDSKNGTFVNEQKIVQSPLKHKDAICIGKHVLLVDLEDEIDVPEVDQRASTPELSLNQLSKSQTMVLDARQNRPSPAQPPPPAPERPDTDTLSILSGGQGDFNLNQVKSLSIGRNKDADIVVGGLWGFLLGSPSALINKQAGDYVLSFTGGLVKPKRNGIGVKGSIRLNHDDIVSIGPIRVQIQLK
jgi:pSer/pThr/pTyr-binding forkhead associated (FHA) protein